MVKCEYFRKYIEHDSNRGTLVYSPMNMFNQWNQKDVGSIISIDTCCNQHGEVETIVVYYNAKEASNNELH